MKVFLKVLTKIINSDYWDPTYWGFNSVIKCLEKVKIVIRLGSLSLGCWGSKCFICFKAHKFKFLLFFSRSVQSLLLSIVFSDWYFDPVLHVWVNRNFHDYFANFIINFRNSYDDFIDIATFFHRLEDDLQILNLGIIHCKIHKL